MFQLNDGAFICLLTLASVFFKVKQLLALIDMLLKQYELISFHFIPADDPTINLKGRLAKHIMLKDSLNIMYFSYISILFLRTHNKSLF